ncbi:MAG: hypothetical protein ACLFQV_06045 [Vulcanimicrobiota bacterium]
MIKDILNEINSVEMKAREQVNQARETANEQIRQARYKAGQKIEDFHRKRSDFITLKIREAETRARQQVSKEAEESKKKSSLIEKDARKNLEEAIDLVFERILNYGNK